MISAEKELKEFENNLRVMGIEWFIQTVESTYIDSSVSSGTWKLVFEDINNKCKEERTQQVR